MGVYMFGHNTRNKQYQQGFTYVFYDTSIDSLVINDYNNMNVD